MEELSRRRARRIEQELETRRERLARSERLSIEGAPRARFAYAAAATKQRAAIARLEQELYRLEMRRLSS